MRIVEIPEGEAEEFKKIHGQLTDGKKANSEGERKVKAAKAFLSDWLLNNRKIVVDTLPLGELVVIKIGKAAAFEIRRKSQGEKIDVKMLEAENPTVANQFRKLAIASYYDPIPMAD